MRRRWRDAVVLCRRKQPGAAYRTLPANHVAQATLDIEDTCSVRCRSNGPGIFGGKCGCSSSTTWSHPRSRTRTNTPRSFPAILLLLRLRRRRRRPPRTSPPPESPGSTMKPRTGFQFELNSRENIPPVQETPSPWALERRWRRKRWLSESTVWKEFERRLEAQKHLSKSPETPLKSTFSEKLGTLCGFWDWSENKKIFTHAKIYISL